MGDINCCNLLRTENENMSNGAGVPSAPAALYIYLARCTDVIVFTSQASVSICLLAESTKR